MTSYIQKPSHDLHIEHCMAWMSHSVWSIQVNSTSGYGPGPQRIYKKTHGELTHRKTDSLRLWVLASFLGDIREFFHGCIKPFPFKMAPFRGHSWFSRGCISAAHLQTWLKNKIVDLPYLKALQKIDKIEIPQGQKKTTQHENQMRSN